MNMRFCNLTIIVFCLFLTACSSGSGSGEPPNNGDGNGTSGGNTAGDTTAGNTTASGSTAGDTTAGDTTAGDTTAGDTTAGDTTGGVVSGISQVGSVLVSRSGSSSFDYISLFADFKEFVPALSDFSLPAVVNPLQDTCIVSTDGSIPTTITTIFDRDIVFYFHSTSATRDQIRDRYFDSQAISLSAGEALVFTSPAGTFSQLNHELSGTQHGYQMPNGSIVGVAPDSLILDIPGDMFPAFANIDIRVLAQVPFQDTRATGDLSDSDFQLSWVADSDDESFIVIRGQANNIDVSPIRIVDFICMVQDDGAFELSAVDQATIVEALNGDPGETAQFTAFSFQRMLYQTQRVDNVLLIVESIVAGARTF